MMRLALCFMAAFLAGCAGPNGNGRHAVCTTGMVADIVRNVGGGRIRVTQMMGEGVDPHTYKASPGDVITLEGADIVFYSGLHLEGKLAELLERRTRRKPTFAVAEALPPTDILEDGGAQDPHVWFDVAMWSQCAGAVADRLASFDPAGEAEYRANARAYQEKLKNLHDDVRKEIATILPRERRVLVTAHDAFRYFGRAYGIEVRGIQGISTESEAGVKQVNQLVDFLVERKIKAIFVESSVSERNVKALIEGCAARGHQVVIGGELFSDAMGKDGTPEGTYEGMVRHNVRTIAKALK